MKDNLLLCPFAKWRVAALLLLLLSFMPLRAATVQHLTMPCTLLQGISEREYVVCLPDGYNPQAERPYPVLYLLHGGGGSCDEWEVQCRLSEAVDSLTRAGVLGDGVGIQPDDDKVVAPFDGTISSVAESQHAVGIESNGMEMLIHVGVYRVEDRSLEASVMYDRAVLALEGIKDDYHYHTAWYEQSMRYHVVTNRRISEELTAADGAIWPKAKLKRCIITERRPMSIHCIRQ